MGLLINQGKQKVESNGIIEAKGVLCRIEQIKLHPKLTESLLVSFKIVGGEKNGIYFKDTICYSPNNPMSWKYTSLRKCANVPYKKGEAERIDIEALLVGKYVACDLSKRLDTKGNEWQNVIYKAASAIKTENTNHEEQAVSHETANEWAEQETAIYNAMPTEERAVF